MATDTAPNKNQTTAMTINMAPRKANKMAADMQ